MSEYFFTSESVSEGHPDKLADIVSDSILDAVLEQDPTARVAAYSKTAAYGHFGRDEPEFTWEKTDKAAMLKQCFS